MWPPSTRLTRRTAAAFGCAIVLSGTVVALPSTAVAAPTAAAPTANKQQARTEFVSLARASSIVVQYRGNGHGHGMSQYGARGAAIQGLSPAKILAFYYPGTTLTTIAPTTIRVWLSDLTTPNTTVFAGTAGLTLTGYGALPRTGYKYFRLIPSGAGFTLQGQKSGSWLAIKTGLPKRADFSATPGWVQVLMADGSSTRYHGTIGAVRSGAGEYTINRVALDLYVQGSVPREVPASWQAAAVRAQAVAARSYAMASKAAAGSGSLYDICDTTWCQSYGGMTHFDRSGHVLWSDDPDALINNANEVLQYKGGPVFAQYSASNGGATVDGGQPYLVGKDDPYDSTASGDPYLAEETTVRTTDLASSYGLRTVTSLQITQRDGHGPWGGRIVAGYVNGTNSAGQPARVATTGFGLGNATGVGTNYLRFASEHSVPAAPTNVRATPGDAGATVSWTAPADTGNLAITRYRLTFAGHTLLRPASARSTWVGPLSNLGSSTVSVRAVNSAGVGAPAAVAVTPRAAPQPIVAVAPKWLFSAAADSGHAYRFSVPGHGDIPKTGARSVQLAVTVHAPSASGVLTIAPAGISATPLAAFAYRAGRNATATVSIPLVPSGTVVFKPSAGSLRLSAVQESYAAAAGSRVHLTARQVVTRIKAVPTGNGSAIAFGRARGVTASTKGVLIAVDAASARPTTLQFWPAGTGRPNAQQVTVSKYSSRTNLLILPISASHRLRIAAGRPGVYARVTLLGTLDSTGGRLETVPASPIIDDAGPHHSRTLGTSPVGVSVAGAPIPSAGVAAVLVQVTVRSGGASGFVWAYPAGKKRVKKPPVAAFAGAGSVTSTTLVKVTAQRLIMLRSSTAGVRVSVDAIGYITSN